MNCPCGGFLYPFPPANCNPGLPQAAGAALCRPHFPALRKNFYVPQAGNAVIIEVTDTESLYIGEGIMIAGGYYIITNVIDSIQLEIKHNGVGATPGNLIIAVHPQFGCFQYPVIPVGKVSLDIVPTVLGLENTATADIAGAIVAVAVQKLTYGFVGPTTIEFQAEVIVQTANSPYWIAIELPTAIRQLPLPAFAAYYEAGAGVDPIAVIAKLGNGAFQNFVVVGPGSGVWFVDGVDRKIVVSGRCEIA